MSKHDNEQRKRRQVPLYKRVIFALIVLVFFLGVVEGTLRICGWGTGKYRIMFLATNLYEPDLDMMATFGPVPYRLRTNSLGMRSREVALEKPTGTTRIIALGDSHTDGFFVDNEATYPWQLEQQLLEARHNVQVLNAAAGGGSIDKQFANLKTVETLNPDIVLLTFCTNDPGDLDSQTKAMFQGDGNQVWGASELRHRTASPLANLQKLMSVDTAIGEFALDMLVRFNSRPEVFNNQPTGNERYNVKGADQFDENAKRFLELAEGWGQEAATQRTSFTPHYARLVERYLELLGEVQAWCQERNIVLVLQYFPEYNQTYLPDAVMTMRDQLDLWCDQHGLLFHDLTPSLRAVGRNEILYLAPLDWHLNPTGYQIMSEAVAKYLIERELVPPASVAHAENANQ